MEGMAEEHNAKPDGFYIDKWFLDFVGEHGEAMIFYAAVLHWKGWEVAYTSWLDYSPLTGTTYKSHLRHVHLPSKQAEVIHWADPDFGVEGTWTANGNPVSARLFDSEAGYLDWRCHQPAARVQLTVGGKTLRGAGYVEQLILTAPPWKIPLAELRWGRFGSEGHQMVWVELKEEETRQWLWWNGERQGPCLIGEDQIAFPDGRLLRFEDQVTMRAGKPIFSVAQKITALIPGFSRIIPSKFLMGEEAKWFGKGVLVDNGTVVSEGHALYELVRFKT